jgi:hypothetical protein
LDGILHRSAGACGRVGLPNSQYKNAQYLLVEEPYFLVVGFPPAIRDKMSTEEKISSHEPTMQIEKTEGQTIESFEVFTPEEEARVIRKLDYRLLPFLFLLYSLSVLDRSNLGNAKLAGLSKDIDIRGDRYNWLGTIFYIACKEPGAILPQGKVTKLTAGRYSVAMGPYGMEAI